MTGVIQTQGQRRAKFAYDKIMSIKGINDKDFKSYIQNLPAMIQTSGLGQAMAYCLSKEDTHKTIYKWLDEWTARQEIYSGKQELLKGIMDGDMYQYQLATAELQALLVWLKKFARAELTSDKDKS